MNGFQSQACQVKPTTYIIRLTTGKNEKEYSWHVPAIKFIGMKQLV